VNDLLMVVTRWGQCRWSWNSAGECLQLPRRVLPATHALEHLLDGLACQVFVLELNDDMVGRAAAWASLGAGRGSQSALKLTTSLPLPSHSRCGARSCRSSEAGGRTWLRSLFASNRQQFPCNLKHAVTRW